MLRLVEMRSVKFSENIHSAAPTDDVAVLYDIICVLGMRPAERNANNKVR